MSFLERHFDKWIPEPNSGCWVWFGSQTSAGYGNATEDMESVYAHRRSWEDANGVILAAGDIVRHRCDFPPCVNPEHLICGTQKDNIRDMWARGRAKVTPVYGERHGRASLTDVQVREIKAAYADGRLSFGVLAARYKSSKSTIYRLVTGQVRNDAQH